MNNCTTNGQINPLWGPRASQNQGQTLWRAFLVRNLSRLIPMLKSFMLHTMKNRLINTLTADYRHFWARSWHELSPSIHIVGWSSCCISWRRQDVPQRASVFAWRSDKERGGGTKSMSGPRGYIGRQLTPLIQDKECFSVSELFYHGSESFKSGDKRKERKKKTGSDQWCHYSRRSGFSHSERSAETSTQHLQQSSKERVNRY